MAQSHDEFDSHYYDYCYSRQPIPSKLLLNAFVDLKSILGMSAVWELITALKAKGISLEIQQRSYSLFQLEQTLSEIFGESETSLLMERLVQSFTADSAGHAA